jgi:uncharacterized protein YecT (DUF1311 family)
VDISVRQFKRSWIFVTAAFLLVIGSSAQEPTKPKAGAPSEEKPCEQAQSQMELNQCSGEQYHKADVRLNAVYRKVLDSLQKNLTAAQQNGDADQAKWNQAAIAKLKAAEKAWIEYRNLHCDAARHQYKGGSMSPLVWAFCMEHTTKDRIEELKQAYEDGDPKLE